MPDTKRLDATVHARGRVARGEGDAMSAELIRSIVAATMYMTLATADVHGSPWAPAIRPHGCDDFEGGGCEGRPAPTTIDRLTLDQKRADYVGSGVNQAGRQDLVN
jgi:hypothetical protein